MSAIDCIDHVHVGMLNENIGIYWPLNEQSEKQRIGFLGNEYKEKDVDFVTDTSTKYGKSLSTQDIDKPLNQYMTFFGGGSGEHPAMPVNNDSVAIKYLMGGNIFKGVDEKTIFENDEIESFFSQFFSFKKSYIYNSKENSGIFYWNIEKDYWPLETYIDLDKSFKELGIANEGYSLETAIQELFGYIIVEVLPTDAIKDEKLKDLVMQYKKLKENMYEYINIEYLSALGLIFEIPEHIFGRNFFREGKNSLKYNYSLEDWHKDNS